MTPVRIHPSEHPVHGLVPGAGHLPGLPAHQVVDGVSYLGQIWGHIRFEALNTMISNH